MLTDAALLLNPPEALRLDRSGHRRTVPKGVAPFRRLLVDVYRRLGTHHARTQEPIGIALPTVDASCVAGGAAGHCRWSVTRTVDGAPSFVDGPEHRNGRTLNGMAVALSPRKCTVRSVLEARDRCCEVER